MIARIFIGTVVMLLGIAAFAQQAPPPPPNSANAPPPPPPGLSPQLAEVTRMIREGQYAAARTQIEAVLATDAKNPQARFLRGVVQTDEGQADDAMATFQALIEEYPELPEPYNNLAVILAQKGQYENAKRALELALASHPDYAIAHENLGDVYARLASAEYDRALDIDKTNKSARTKLALVRELFAVESSSTAPKPPVPKPAAPPKR